MTKEEIHRICSEYNIKNYTINEDLSIDVDDSVDLDGYKSDIKIKEFPLKFRNVSGAFDCSNNDLTSLEGSPNIVKRGYYCYSNKLTSLKGSPSYVGGTFDCEYNPLESLNGISLNLSGVKLVLPKKFTYNDYLTYCKVVERDFKFKKLLK